MRGYGAARLTVEIHELEGDMVTLRILVVLLVTGFVDMTNASLFCEGNNLAIDGCDPVACFTDQKAVKGSSEFRTDYHGATFQSVSAAHEAAFTVNPEQYIPQYGRYYAYGMAKGYKVKIDPRDCTVVHGKLYLSDSDAVRG